MKKLFVSIIVFWVIGLFSGFATAGDAFDCPYDYWSYGHSRDFPVEIRVRIVDEYNKKMIVERLKKIIGSSFQRVVYISAFWYPITAATWTWREQLEWEQQAEFHYKFAIPKKDGSCWEGEAVVKKKPYYHVEIRPMKKTGKHNCVMERVVK